MLYLEKERENPPKTILCYLDNILKFLTDLPLKSRTNLSIPLDGSQVCPAEDA